MPSFLDTDSPYLDVSFIVPGEPVSKARARFTRYGSKVRAYTPERTKDGERRVAAAFRGAARLWQADAEHEFAVEATFHAGTRQRRDIDNMCKLLLDALNKIAWEDDRQVTQLTSRVVHGAAEPRTEVHIISFRAQPKFQRTCAYCGEGFDTFPASRARYCGTTCAHASKVKSKAKVCLWCKKEFQAKRPSKDKYCSTACWSAKKRIDVRVTLTCPTCSKGFDVHPSQAPKRTYCSNACRRGPHTPPGRGK